MAAKTRIKNPLPSDRTRERVHQLQGEIAELKSVIGLNSPRKVDEWLMLPQNIRDDMAVRALWDCFCDHYKATLLLGFKVEYNDMEERARLTGIIFDTDGVRERLARTTKTAEENRTAVIERLTQTALNANDDRSVRAAQVLSKMEGWQREDKPPAPATEIHLWGLTAGAGMIAQNSEKRVTTIEHQIPSDDPRVVLGHNPGAPKRFGTEEELITQDGDE